MSRRDGWSEERREAERTRNRERMRRLSADPEYRRRVYARRKAAQAAKPALRDAPRRASAAYYRRHRDDPAFMAQREAYMQRWKAERRLNEEFDAFMSRMLAEDGAS